MSSENIGEDGNVITMVHLQNEIKIINERMKERIFNNRSLKMQEIVNTQNSKSYEVSQIKVGGKLINNTKEISNKYEYFVNVGPTTEESIPKTQNIFQNRYWCKKEKFQF